MFDYVIIGAGFAGSVMAERLAKVLNKRVLIVEKRQHIGGNCYDFYDQYGVLVHKYGPHLFHTSNKKVFDYLSQFTEWIEYHHRVLVVVDGNKVPLPFNLNSLRLLFPESMASSLETKLIERYGFDVKVPILELKKEKDKELHYLADFIYRKIFSNYTAKQWACTPEEISPEVTARVPVFISRDDRYFQDKYQAVPRQGYTKLFENMISHENIKLMLNTDYKEILHLNLDSGKMELFGQNFNGHVIYTGMVDELFGYRFGELPYRSLKFDFEHLSKEYFQEVTTINYPENFDFTRITEFKHITKQEIRSTTIVREYPQDYDRLSSSKNIPYYPVFNDGNMDKYKLYQEFSKKFSNITLIGRLAEYKYYDMDDIVAQALELFQSDFCN
ncbi:MAG: UDP-galactopyranose mutase [Methylothermaceae bacteria B42]|nr:MAG: UDP-galactopyranose mutase [Methylothermaceae bacteria B42]HHJ40172.1 UDP-galactopyranose mutase [Methylothermaceae bacterium]